MGTPPNEELADLERELVQVTGQRDLMPRKKEIEDRLVELRRENDQALGEDLVDKDLIEPGS